LTGATRIPPGKPRLNHIIIPDTGERGGPVALLSRSPTVRDAYAASESMIGSKANLDEF